MLLIPELLLRGESQQEVHSMNYQSKINKLKNYSNEEKYMSYILNVLETSTSVIEAALALVEQAVPCILHSDMIITENFVKLIIQQGINFYIDERQSYVEELETLMNTHVCGS